MMPDAAFSRADADYHAIYVAYFRRFFLRRECAVDHHACACRAPLRYAYVRYATR